MKINNLNICIIRNFYLIKQIIHNIFVRLCEITHTIIKIKTTLDNPP